MKPPSPKAMLMPVSMFRSAMCTVQDLIVCVYHARQKQFYTTIQKKYAKSQQHPKDFPGGHPPQYYPGLPPLNFGVRMGSGVFDAVWPLTRSMCVTFPL